MPLIAESPACAAGTCQCNPACKTQLARVEARRQIFQDALRPVPAETISVVLSAPPPAGKAWLCLACARLQPGPGAHCGYEVRLVEYADLERDPVTGRVTRATAAEIPSLYRKASPGALGTWKPHGS